MRALALALALLALPAVAQEAEYYPPGITASTSGTVTRLLTTDATLGLGVAQGSKVSFDGATANTSITFDGTNLIFNRAGSQAGYFGNGGTLQVNNGVAGSTAVFNGDVSALAATSSVKLGRHTNLPGLWFVNAAPSLTNYAFLFDNTNVILNAPSGGRVDIRANNSTYLSASAALTGACVSNGTAGTCDGVIVAGTVQAGNQSFTNTGANFSNGITSLSHTAFFGRARFDPQILTVADNGGGTAATATLTPSASEVDCSCADANGCTITMGETGMASGVYVTIIASTANVCTFADTSGVSELTGAISLGQWDSLTLMYLTDRWVQVSTSNN